MFCKQSYDDIIIILHCYWISNCTTSIDLDTNASPNMQIIHWYLWEITTENFKYVKSTLLAQSIFCLQTCLNVLINNPIVNLNLDVHHCWEGSSFDWALAEYFHINCSSYTSCWLIRLQTVNSTQNHIIYTDHKYVKILNKIKNEMLLKQKWIIKFAKLPTLAKLGSKPCYISSLLLTINICLHT